MKRQRGSALKSQPVTSRESGGRRSAALEVIALVGIDLAVVTAWTTWWHVSDFSGDGTLSGVLMRAAVFLSWTFVPCWALAFVILLTATPAMRRSRTQRPATLRAALTLLAPPLWAVGYCAYYKQMEYVPTAMLVAEAGWVVTLQPLWAYLAFYRTSSQRRTH